MPNNAARITVAPSTQTRGGCSDGGQNRIPADRYTPALIDVPVPPAPSL